MRLNKFQICAIAVIICFVGVYAVPVADANPIVPIIKGIKEVAKKVVKPVAKFFHRGEIRAFHKSLGKFAQQIKDNPRLRDTIKDSIKDALKGTIIGCEIGVAIKVIGEVIVIKINKVNSTPYEIKLQPNDDDQFQYIYVNNMLLGGVSYQDNLNLNENVSEDKRPKVLGRIINESIKGYDELVKKHKEIINQAIEEASHQ